MVARLKGISRGLKKLSESVDQRFGRVDQRFGQVDQRFEQIDRRFEQIDERFEQIDRRFEQIDQRFEQIDQRFEQIDQRFEQIDQRFDGIQQLILSESEKTRRHFDVAVEQIKSERNLSIDKSIATEEHLTQFRVSNAADHIIFEKRLDDHEHRLKLLETGMDGPLIPTSPDSNR
jgi:uncharacterized protein (DUF3084 family)